VVTVEFLSYEYAYTGAMLISSTIFFETEITIISLCDENMVAHQISLLIDT
jgi:hypothetical protein